MPPYPMEPRLDLMNSENLKKYLAGLTETNSRRCVVDSEEKETGQRPSEIDSDRCSHQPDKTL